MQKVQHSLPCNYPYSRYPTTLASWLKFSSPYPAPPYTPRCLIFEPRSLIPDLSALPIPCIFGPSTSDYSEMAPILLTSLKTASQRCNPILPISSSSRRSETVPTTEPLHCGRPFSALYSCLYADLQSLWSVCSGCSPMSTTAIRYLKIRHLS